MKWQKTEILYINEKLYAKIYNLTKKLKPDSYKQIIK